MKSSLIYIAWAVLVSVAIILRFQDLGERPVHADEATGARILAQQIEGEDYKFDATHFHGPILSQTTLPIARIAGDGSWQALRIETLRIGTALAGLLLVFTPLLWLGSIGKWGAWGAAALLGTSPLLVYYSRMYIHESWLALFGMLACAGVYHVTIKPTLWRAAATGLAIGLMFATKETFAISVLSWVPAGLLLLFLLKKADQHGEDRPNVRTYLKAAAAMIITALAAAGLLYTDFLRQPAQFADAFRTFFDYQTTPGHEKAFSYYLELLLVPHRLAQTWWTEGFVALLAVFSPVLARKNPAAFRACLFLSAAALLHLLIYSAIGYKTPWLMLLPWAQVCLLAGVALHSLSKAPGWIQTAFVLFFLLGTAHQTQQSLLANGRLSHSHRNPYAYVPTTGDPANLSAWLVELNAMQPFNAIAVVGNGYWPLPWYLKELNVEIGYWPSLTEDMTPFAVVFALPESADEIRDQLATTHVELARGLRVNVPLTLFLRNDIWEGWQENQDDE